ncbi:glutamate racemase [Thermovibrio sp.]
MADRAIGIFDSGVGGLTVLKAIRDLLPGENLIYFGDTARVPYGTKSQRTIIRYSIQNARLLESYRIKMLVVACNTSSAHALEILREEFPFPVIGVVKPGAKLAVSATKGGKVGVIGTEATVKSHAYRKEIISLNPFCEVYEKACPLLVPLIEEGWLDDPITKEVVRRYLEPLVGEGIDTLVLGCTHYPLIKGVIGELYPHLNLIDSADAVAKEVERNLPTKRKGERGFVKVLVSDRTERFERIAKMIMGREVRVEEVNIDKE